MNKNAEIKEVRILRRKKNKNLKKEKLVFREENNKNII